MPLHRGSSKETISRNIKEMMDSWHRSGKIGNTKTKNKKKAQDIAVAAAEEKAKKSLSADIDALEHTMGLTR